MGVLINLGKPTTLRGPRGREPDGPSVELRAGDRTSDPGDRADNAAARAADGDLVKGYTPIGQPVADSDGTRMVFTSMTTAQYLMVWITNLPPKGDRTSL